jgi:hypothetical protein
MLSILSPSCAKSSSCKSTDGLRYRMLKLFLLGLLSFAISAAPALAAVSLTDDRQITKSIDKKGKGGVRPLTTGAISLIDNSGLRWFINTNITFSTSSSASGAMSEAGYTHAVDATTLNGGVVQSTLNDAFDGYEALCISLTGALGPCATGNANYIMYDRLGPATTELSGRQVVFPTQTIPGTTLTVSRKVFVPTNDSFARWLNFFTNTGSAPITFNVITSNNLGSDSNTRIVTSSNGNNTAELADSWITTFQNYSGTTSSDPRLGHVLQGTNQSTLSNINFVDGGDNPYWAYTITLNPGQTKAIMTFAVGQPGKAAAATKSAELANLSNPEIALQGMTAAERNLVVNFTAAAKPPAPVPTMNEWGMITLILLAGWASVHYLLRRKKINS